MFNKKKSVLPPQRPPTPPPPAAPPRFVRYDRNEKRGYVLNIVEVRAPNDGEMQVRLADAPDWLTLHKAKIDVRAVLKEFTYNAVFFDRGLAAKDGARYRQGLKCEVVLRGFGGRSPLIAFPPFERSAASVAPTDSADDELDFDPDDDGEGDAEATADDESGEYYTTWGIYTAAFSDVSVNGGSEPDEAEDARPQVKLWDTEQEADDAQGALLEERKALVAEGKKHALAWPRCVLNTHNRFLTPRWNEPDIRSYLTLPPVVFEGLRRDIVAMGPSLRVEALLTIEAYVLNWGQNYGYGEFEDHRFNFDLALIPHDSVLSCDLKKLEVKWREAGSIRNAETREERMEEAAPALDVDPTRHRNRDD